MVVQLSGTTAIADGDGLLINDAGTMRVSTVQTLAAYLDDEITAMPNLVTMLQLLLVNRLTSGFTSIDVGAGQSQRWYCTIVTS